MVEGSTNLHIDHLLMYVLLLLAGLVALLSLAGIAGWLAHRYTGKRWLQIAVSLFVVWLPFWDVIPGLYFYYKAIREVGGVHIYRTVKAEGYLDLTVTDCTGCWTWLSGSPHRYIEVLRTVPGMELPTLEAEPGYYEYQLLPAGSAACQPFESLPNAARIMRRRGIPGKCVAIARRDNAISRYELSALTVQLPFGAKVFSRRVRDRSENTIVAESNQVYFTSRLGRQVGVPSWQYTDEPDGTHITIVSTDVIEPG